MNSAKGLLLFLFIITRLLQLHFTYLKFRTHQIFREFIDAGLLYGSLLFLMFSMYVLLIYKLLHSNSHAIYALLFCLLPVLTVYLNRKDLFFLRKLSSNFKWLLFTDYFLISIPVIIESLAACTFKISILAIGSCILPAIFPLAYGRNNTAGAPLVFIPPGSFEIKVGIRSNKFLAALLILVSTVLSYLPIITIVILWFIHTIFVSFYKNCESRAMLVVQSANGSTLLKRKITPITASLLLFNIS